VRRFAPAGRDAAAARRLASRGGAHGAAFLTRRATLAGFEKPSAIQQRGIVPFCRGYDVIQQAQSGTGKTATFCAGILHQVSSLGDAARSRRSARVRSPTGTPLRSWTTA
jgi:hypothetical protein